MASKQRPLDLSEFCKTSFHAAASPDFTAVYMPCGSRGPPEQAFERFPLGTLETYHRVRQQIRHSAGHENIPKGCLARFRTTGTISRPSTTEDSTQTPPETFREDAHAWFLVTTLSSGPREAKHITWHQQVSPWRSLSNAFSSA